MPVTTSRPFASRPASSFQFGEILYAKEAGVARATVYEHFRSKRAVLDELASSIARSVVIEESRGAASDPLIALILASVVVVMLDSVPSIRADWHEALYAAEWVFTIVFTVDQQSVDFLKGRLVSHVAAQPVAA